ncbi:MAG: segregation/condensation protein A [Hyphomicrobiales bacterium]|nr:segregation/condensation protein A [Hyphomicrobiales bacterium]MCP5372704.1 segregation/condensation protein A [Hyphomicrobiales bacterium]
MAVDNSGFELVVDNPPGAAEAFVVDLDGFEGPIDMLLAMARDQKVDLAHISILELADQYLAFVVEARKRNLELAADYLVMAAWLAYLKSRLLLPDLEAEDEPTGEEMAAALQFQMARLAAMQKVGARLMARPRLGQDFFHRGDPERFLADTQTVFEVTLYDLLKAYGGQLNRAKPETLRIEQFELFTVDDALQRLRRVLGSTPDWSSLEQFLPDEFHAGTLSPVVARSALASTFTATLEMAREGKLRLRQGETFGPIYVKAATGEPHAAGGADNATDSGQTEE